MRRALTTVAIVVGGASAWATWAEPMAMPVERLVANLSHRIAEAPNDAAAHFLLGRVHSYAFVFSSRIAAAFFVTDNGFDGLENIVGCETFAKSLPEREKNLERRLATGQETDWITDQLEVLRAAREKGPLSDDELKNHLRLGVKELLKAAELKPDEGDYHLGLAYLLEQGAPSADKLDEDPLVPPEAPPAPPASAPADDGEVPKPLVAHAAAWSARAEAEYLRAFDLDAGPLLLRNERPKGPGGLRDAVSYEAALGALRLMGSRPAQPGDDKRRAELQDHLKRVDALPEPRWVTPILFSLDTARSLDALLSDRTAVFDLDGDGHAERWPWLQPDTALLVWNPDATGCVTSGLQLFGSVTWWLFFDDGYHALDLLDDDGDGWLSGAELAGLAIWQDRDGDGVSGPGEVVPIERTDIAALSTHATGEVGRSLVSEQGLRLRDGRALPTYDWVTSPIAEP